MPTKKYITKNTKNNIEKAFNHVKRGINTKNISKKKKKKETLLTPPFSLKKLQLTKHRETQAMFPCNCRPETKYVA
jgi:hypothetical protein